MTTPREIYHATTNGLSGLTNAALDVHLEELVGGVLQFAAVVAGFLAILYVIGVSGRVTRSLLAKIRDCRPGPMARSLVRRLLRR